MRRIATRSCRSRSNARGGCGLPAIAAEHILVVGDTPHDIACARAAGAVAVGVATGGFTVDQLIECGGDVVFEDLSDREAFLKLLD